MNENDLDNRRGGGIRVLKSIKKTCGSCGKSRKGALNGVLPRYGEEIVKYETEVLGINSNNF